MSGRKKATTSAGEVKKNKESQLMIKKGKKDKDKPGWGCQ